MHSNLNTQPLKSPQISDFPDFSSIGVIWGDRLCDVLNLARWCLIVCSSSSCFPISEETVFWFIFSPSFLFRFSVLSLISSHRWHISLKDSDWKLKFNFRLQSNGRPLLLHQTNCHFCVNLPFNVHTFIQPEKCTAISKCYCALHKWFSVMRATVCQVTKW